MKRAKWYLGLLLVGILLVVGGCTDEPVPPVEPVEPTGYSDISIPIGEFQNQPHIDVVMSTVLGGELTVTLGSNPTTGYQWSEDAEISDESIVGQTNHEFIAPETDEPGTPGEEVWTFKALKRGTTTILLEYIRSWNDAGLWAVTITATIE
jgi:inhibitor of cysteine peptidase